MPSIDLQIRKQWWLLCYACTSMDRAAEICNLIVGNCDSNKHALFQPLAVAAHAYYARPFKRSNKVGSLCDDIVPVERLNLHRWLIDFRDSVFSHTDANVSAAAGKPMHDVIYHKWGSFQDYTCSDPRCRIDSYSIAAMHCKKMGEIVFERLFEMQAAHGEHLPTEDGDYLLCLQEDGPLFVPHVSVVESVLKYE